MCTVYYVKIVLILPRKAVVQPSSPEQRRLQYAKDLQHPQAFFRDQDWIWQKVIVLTSRKKGKSICWGIRRIRIYANPHDTTNHIHNIANSREVNRAPGEARRTGFMGRPWTSVSHLYPPGRRKRERNPCSNLKNCYVPQTKHNNITPSLVDTANHAADMP